MVSISQGEEDNLLSRVLVARACNPSYSGGRDQEDFNPRSTPDKKYTRKTLSQLIGGHLSSKLLHEA
jgi:hypothetical protein